MSARRRVAVFFGGPSDEHEVSCESARSVVTALDELGDQPHLVGITRSGGWTPVDRDAFARPGWQRVEQLAPTGKHGRTTMPAALATLHSSGVAVALPMLHGVGGEDGSIQAVLELAGVPYVGSGVLSSAICLDKDVSKRLLRAAGLPTCPAITLHASDRPAEADVAELGLPCFVKPARGGSSLGVTRITTVAELPAAVAAARAHDPKVLIEPEIHNRELSCCLLEGPDGDLHCEGPAETTTGASDWLDFATKYDDPTCLIRTSPDLPPGAAERATRLALAAYRVLECSGLLRVDLFLDTGGGLVINEVNTLPGLTTKSIFPEVWQEAGLSYPRLVDQLLSVALRPGHRKR